MYPTRRILSPYKGKAPMTKEEMELRILAMDERLKVLEAMLKPSMVQETKFGDDRSHLSKHLQGDDI